MADRLTFAELLRQHRHAAGLTQDELADRSRLSTRAISDLERGVKQTPQRATLQLLIAALALSSEDAARLTALAHRQPTGPPPPAASQSAQTPQHAGSAGNYADPTPRPRTLAGYLAPFPPETKYAASNDVSIAYQVLGNGPIDLVAIPGSISHVELCWEDPSFARFYQRLAAFSRLIIFDKRGTGMSDRVAGIAGLEQRMDDVRAVMDAAGSERAVLFGLSEGGPMAMLFAATYPERTAGLVLYGTFARDKAAPDYPWRDPLPSPEEAPRILEESRERWGTDQRSDEMLRRFVPSMANDERYRRWFSSYLRRGVSPGAWVALRRMNWEIDVRHILPAIHVPALVIHRVDELVAPIGNGRYLASHIPGAELMELPGVDHLPWIGDSDRVIAAMEHFLARLEPTDQSDRVLATVLAVELGAGRLDAAGQGNAHGMIPAQHVGMFRRELAHFRGREIRLGREGAQAAFDGPGRAIRCAGAISSGFRQASLPVRIGLHTGECEVGETGLRGTALHIAAQVARRAGAGAVLVSSTVKDLVAGSGFQFREQGSCSVDGVDGSWRLYEVQQPAPPHPDLPGLAHIDVGSPSRRC